MEVYNIIDNCNLKILMENMLILNQFKLLNSIIHIFEHGDLSHNDIILNKSNVKEYLDKQKFINWELFIDLINLDHTTSATNAANANNETNNASELIKNKSSLTMSSMYYIIKFKSTRLVEFLLDLTLDNYKINSLEKQINWAGVFVYIIKKMYYCDSIMNKLIDLILVDFQYRELLNKPIYNNKTTAFYLMSKCSESIILRLVKTNLIELGWKDDYANGLVHWACKRNFNELFNLTVENNLNLNLTNNGGRTPLHLACIKNNVKNNMKIVKSLIEKNASLNIIDFESNLPINYAIKYGKLELVKLLFDEDIFSKETESDLFYQMIKSKNEELVTYFMNSNLMNIDSTNWIWSMMLFGNNFMFSQMVQYSKKKLFLLIVDYYTNMDNHYDGYYMNDMFS